MPRPWVGNHAERAVAALFGFFWSKGRGSGEVRTVEFGNYICFVLWRLAISRIDRRLLGSFVTGSENPSYLSMRVAERQRAVFVLAPAARLTALAVGHTRGITGQRQRGRAISKSAERWWQIETKFETHVEAMQNCSGRLFCRPCRRIFPQGWSGPGFVSSVTAGIAAVSMARSRVRRRWEAVVAFDLREKG